MSPQTELKLEPHDFSRMAKQRKVIYALMRQGEWWSLAALEFHTGYPQASISARIRDYRKDKYGGHTVERKRETGKGTFYYRLVVT